MYYHAKGPADTLQANAFRDEPTAIGPAASKSTQPRREVMDSRDTQTGMLHGIPRSARCVQRFDDSLNSAIHITYRISLRSSSMREPRDPLLKVLFLLWFLLHSLTYRVI